MKKSDRTLLRNLKPATRNATTLMARGLSHPAGRAFAIGLIQMLVTVVEAAVKSQRKARTKRNAP